MNFNPPSRSVLPILLLVVAALAALPALAQEEAQEDEGRRIGSIRAEIEGWISQPSGLEYTSATARDLDDGFSSRLVGPDFGTEAELRYRLHYDLPKKFGTIVGTYYVHQTEEDLQMFAPGDYIFGEQLTHTLFAGVNNDGLSDGFIADTYTKLRDTRLEFVRPAFRTAKASGDWSVGWQRVSHDRFHEATYFALVPDIPSVIPPAGDCSPGCLDLSPSPDFATISSQYDGRGPTAGLDVDFPLWKDKVVFEGGVSFTVLRGDTDADYSAINNFYVLEMQNETIVLGPPYDEFAYYTDPTRSTLCVSPTQDLNGDGIPDCGAEPVPASEAVDEYSVGFGLQADSRSTTSEVLELNLGFRWHVLKWLDVTGGFRSARYTDVGVELRPKVVSTPPNDPFPEDGVLVINVEDVDEVDRSVTYEGFYVGAVFRIF